MQWQKEIMDIGNEYGKLLNQRVTKAALDGKVVEDVWMGNKVDYFELRVLDGSTCFKMIFFFFAKYFF